MYTDDFSSDNGIVKCHSTVTSTAQVSGGVLTVTWGTGGFVTGSWGLPQTNSRNFHASVEVITYTNQPVITFRTQDSSNFGFVWITGGSLKISKRIAGTTTHISTTAITDALQTKTYRVDLHVVHNTINATVYDGDVLVAQAEVVDADFEKLASSPLGFANVTASTSQSFDNLVFSPVPSQTNIISIGDSNTKFALFGYEQCYPNKMQELAKYKGVTVRNAGVGGNGTADMITRFAADVTAHYIPTARNILTILAGNNDIGSLTYAQSYTNISTMVADGIAAGFEVYVCKYPKAGAYFPATYQPFVDGLNGLIEAGAGAGGYTVIDFHDAIGCTVGSAEYPAKYKYSIPDNERHYSELAHDVFASTALTTMGIIGRTTAGRREVVRNHPYAIDSTTPATPFDVASTFNPNYGGDWSLVFNTKFDLLPRDTGANVIHISQEDGTGTGRTWFYVLLAGGKIGSFLGNKGIVFDYIPDHSYHLYMLRYNAITKDLDLYVDGAYNSTYASLTIENATGSLRFFVTKLGLTGSISKQGETRLYSRLITADEFADMHYDNQYSRSSIELELLMTENAGNPVDTSPNGYATSIGVNTWTSDTKYKPRTVISGARTAITQNRLSA